MNHWHEGKIEKGYGQEGIIMNSKYGNVLSVADTDKGIQFTEECDGWFTHVCDIEDALKLVEELKQWLLSRDKKK